MGAGPTGLYTGVALARRGHAVTLVDRDGGPRRDGVWDRKGVMQFHHPHAFRKPVCDALLTELPDVFHALIAAGAETFTVAGLGNLIVGLRCRRVIFEGVLRAAAESQGGLTLRVGNADEVTSERGRATGVRVDGHRLDADLVIDASGRAGRITGHLRRQPEGGDCGFAYVSRQYQLLPGAEPGPVNAPIRMVAQYVGYLAIVFAHERGIFSTLIQRAAAAACTTPTADSSTRPDESRSTACSLSGTPCAPPIPPPDGESPHPCCKLSGYSPC